MANGNKHRGDKAEKEIGMGKGRRHAEEVEF